ncbi:translation elongation factor Tu [Kwoniella pini CBS 10737]|uniref:Eukaryotic peptide chain release factor GTP-binding subunit n=1 Tax=Kwoniella pini CBS 10737 TaxID=1296096 RepID=A0A1B9HZZ6_9TREE|nr:translation elongation factor Tu [Kwoniella pini CBS 10737]OCF48808.1 translation elongation factor Tu [Kwoniella pini CBS 10737]
MAGQPPPNGFNPGAFEFRPGTGAPFVPRQQGQQQGYPGQQQQQQQSYGQYQQGGYGGYPQQAGQGGYGGYPQYGAQQGGYGGYQSQPQSQAYVPPGARQQQQQPPVRNVQGFQPPSLPPTSSSPKPDSTTAGKPVSLSIGGGAPKAAPSLSIGGGAPKAAPSLSIGGGAPKSAPSISIGGAPKAAPSLSIGGAAKAAPSLSIGGAKKPEEKKTETASSTPAKSSTPQPEETPAPVPASATDAQVKVVASTTDAPAPSQSSTPAPPAASGTSTPSGTNFTKVSAKNDADAILKEQAAAGAEALKDLYGDDAKDTNVKSHLNIIFTGHVDAGKSTMGGQLLFLTGAVDKRTMEKYEQEAKAAGRETWYLSWALDSNKEERAKGKTIEVGRSYFESDKRRYTILDAPGHKTYVPSMITGAAQADVAILVLSGRKGEFETGFERDGQTREHAMLIKNNGINKLVVVVNKMDDPTVQWDKGRYDEVCTKITPFLKSVGFNPKTDITFIPVSAQQGQNMKERVDKKIAPWSDGPALLEFLDNMEVIERDIDAPVVIPIQESYAELGTMVMGKIEAGRVKKGDKLLVMPNKSPVEVTAIYTEQGDEMEYAYCGDNCRIRIGGISEKDVSPGFVLCSSVKPVRTVTAFKADLSIIEAKNIITNGYNCVLHAHTVAEEVTLTALLAYYDKKSRRKSKKAPQFAKQGMLVSALIETAAPICLETYKDSKILGRFSLRDEGKTVAIGKVTKLIEKTEDMPDIAGLKVNTA